MLLVAHEKSSVSSVGKAMRVTMQDAGHKEGPNLEDAATIFS